MKVNYSKLKLKNYLNLITYSRYNVGVSFTINENGIKPNFTLDENINIAKKQVYWRIRNIGQKELELLIGNWWEKNNENMKFSEISEFNKEVLEMDNPTMNKYFVKLEKPEEKLKYTYEILKNL